MVYLTVFVYMLYIIEPGYFVFSFLKSIRFYRGKE